MVECGSQKPSGFLEKLVNRKGQTRSTFLTTLQKKKGLSAKLFGNDFAYDVIKQSLCMPIM